MHSLNNPRKDKQIESNMSLGWVFFSVVLSLVLFPLWSHHEGRSYSKEIRDKYLEKGCFYEKDSLWSNCSSLKGKDGKTLYKGILIAHTKEYVAFFDCKGTVITEIPNGGTVINELSGDSHNIKNQAHNENKS